MNIAIIGKGLFGTAIGSLLEHNKHEFAYVDIDLPMKQMADVVILTTPAQFIRSALTQNQKWFKPEVVFINCAKGIEQETHLLPHQIVTEVCRPSQYFCLMGPSFAHEIVDKQPTLLSLGYSHAETSQAIAGLFSTPYCHIQTSPDFIAIEYVAALKNVYAILCGFAEGLGYGMNARTKIITLALQETAQYINAKDWKFHGAVQPGIMGDLVMTCNSTESRNFTFGTFLATLTPAEAIDRVGGTVEGRFTSTSIQALAKESGVALPLATLTHTILTKGKEGRADFDQVLTQL